MREAKTFLELHYHDDTKQVRTYALTGDENPLRFH
jgi:hypothetical protein